MAKVIMISADLYARWRAAGASRQALREDPEVPPPERLLQAIWQQQRLARDRLRTLDGRPVRVLHPGFRNYEAGPDFRGAMVQIGSEGSRIGDVEIDVRAAGWRAHGHDRNPAFRQVVLHVIWEGASPAAEGLPALALRGMLDAPLGELNSWLNQDLLPALPESMRGQCGAPLRALPREMLMELLHQAASVRRQGKANWFQARAREVGWEQALWEGIFRALGYKQNVWPMQCLAELRPRWGSLPCAPPACQARLFGVGNLLPSEIDGFPPESDGYLGRIWDQWWRERDQFGDCILPPGLWRFNGLRPANQPMRRLALAAHWLAAGDLMGKLETWFTADLPDARLLSSLLEILQVERDEFWSWHWTLRSARLTRPQPMLGAGRVTDLAVNVILPWFWMRAVEGGNQVLRRVAEHRYFAWPAAADNSGLRLARQRLLGGAGSGVLPGAAAQQGLLQILRDFCDHSNALCEQCRFPELVRNVRVGIRASSM